MVSAAHKDLTSPQKVPQGHEVWRRERREARETKGEHRERRE